MLSCLHKARIGSPTCNVAPCITNGIYVCRQLHSSAGEPKPDVTSVAVLGGGITGLATAYYLSKGLPQSTRIELFEASSRLGGWIGSSRIDVGGETVLFENGPRSLRPAGASGLVTLDLISELGLQNRIIATEKTSPAARNRYIYYPDHLVRLPAPGAGIIENLRTIFREKIFDGVRSGVLSEVNKPKRSAEVQDESVGDFISRRFGHHLANNILSAVFHGIYAGDIYKLSARSLVPSLWFMEERFGSIMRGLLQSSMSTERPVSVADLKFEKTFRAQLDAGRRLKRVIGDPSLYTFQHGLGELVNALLAQITKMPNVFIKTNQKVERIECEGQQQNLRLLCAAKFSNGASEFQRYSHLVSTVRSPLLANCLTEPDLSGLLRVTPSVTVMVVNLFYETTNLTPVRGFGYLLPQSLSLDQNANAALGVIFDTDAIPQQDSRPGTKLTVILGGHWWEGWSDYPNEQEGLRRATNTLKHHLDIDAKPDAFRVTLQTRCIPQYMVGHIDSMAQISRSLRQHFKGRLRVGGSSYTGVGVNDCIRAAKEIAQGLIDNDNETGLESFEAGRPWCWSN